MLHTAVLMCSKSAVSALALPDVDDQCSQQHRIYLSLRLGAPAAKFNECYFGFLYTMEDTAVYGYMTPTRIKIVVALELADAVVRDADIISVSPLPIMCAQKLSHALDM